MTILMVVVVLLVPHIHHLANKAVIALSGGTAHIEPVLGRYFDADGASVFHFFHDFTAFSIKWVYDVVQGEEE